MREQSELINLDFDSQSLTTVAHELKSPLALIRQLSLFLENGDLTPEMSKKLLKQITATSEKALRLAGDLSKINNRQLEFDLEPINPLIICKEVTDELDLWYKIHQKKIKVKTKSKNYLAVANRELLKSILINFCDNALHYANQNSTVELKVTRNNDKIRLAVRDYGPKIPKKIWRQINQQKISPQKLITRPESSGLGIYIASEMAHQMNAQIGLISHQDGATFYVELNNSKQMSLI